jgi:predicted nucleic acid-binding protein
MVGEMIHLDTNFVVDLVTLGSRGRRLILAWSHAGKTIATSAVAWSEFCNGPLTWEQKNSAWLALGKNIKDFTWREAEEASRLFNLTGRRRTSHSDCMIAAAAIMADRPLATLNTNDFIRFIPHGLRLQKIG